MDKDKYLQLRINHICDNYEQILPRYESKFERYTAKCKPGIKFFLEEACNKKFNSFETAIKFYYHEIYNSIKFNYHTLFKDFFVISCDFNSLPTNLDNAYDKIIEECMQIACRKNLEITIFKDIKVEVDNFVNTAVPLNSENCYTLLSYFFETLILRLHINQTN